MNYNTAVGVLRCQAENIRRVNNARIFRNGFEYRLTWYGGFAAYVGIDYRKIGGHKFEYFGGISAAHCFTIESVLNLATEEIDKRTVKA